MSLSLVNSNHITTNNATNTNVNDDNQATININVNINNDDKTTFRRRVQSDHLAPTDCINRLSLDTNILASIFTV